MSSNTCFRWKHSSSFNWDNSGEVYLLYILRYWEKGDIACLHAAGVVDVVRVVVLLDAVVVEVVVVVDLVLFWVVVDVVVDVIMPDIVLLKALVVNVVVVVGIVTEDVHGFVVSLCQVLFAEK